MGNEHALTGEPAELYRAACARENETVQRLLVKGVSARSAVWHAIWGRQDRVLCLLLDAGVDLLAISFEDGQSALHLASCLAYPNQIAILLGAGFDPSGVDARGRTPLHLATHRRTNQIGDCRLMSYDAMPVSYDWDVWRDSVDLLLTAGANLDCQDDNGNTPVHMAAEQQAWNALALMTAFGGLLIGVHNRQGQTPRDIACSRDGSEKMEFLDDLRSFPLHLVALAGGSAAAVDAVIQRGAAVHAVTGERHSALHYAAGHTCYTDALLSLIEHGADVDGRDRDGDTPLHLAAEAGHAAQVKALLNSSASPDAINDLGQTPAQRARQSIRDRKIRLRKKRDDDAPFDAEEQYRLVLSVLG